MIFGIGTDIVNIKRIEKILNIYPDLFLKKYFCKDEIERYINKKLTKQQFASKIAKLFASKEAFVKALGTGFRFGISLKDISIQSDKFGKPFLQITGNTLAYIEKEISSINDLKFYISLSDDYPNTIAFVIIEK